MVQSSGESGQDGEGPGKQSLVPSLAGQAAGALWLPCTLSSVEMPQCLTSQPAPEDQRAPHPTAAPSHVENIFPAKPGGEIFKSDLSSAPGTTPWLDAAVSLREGHWARVAKTWWPEEWTPHLACTHISHAA